MPDVRLPRDILKQFLPNHQAIRAFEQVLDQISGALPTTIEEANNNASIAIAAANAALSAFNDLAYEVMTLANAPLPELVTVDDDVAPRFAVTPEYSDIVMRYEPVGQDDVAPRAELGTISAQNSNYVEITGGSIDNTPIGATTASTVAATTLTASGTVTLSPANANVTISPTGTGTVALNPATTGSINNMTIGATTPRSGAFTTVSATGQITSTLATGTAPFVVASTTKVANLNADLLDGTDWAAPGTIGGTTPGSATFTTVTTTGNVTVRGNVVQIGPNAAVAGNGGNVRLNDDTATLRWLMGLLGTAGATSWSLRDVVAGLDRITVNAAGQATFGIGITVPGGAQFLTTNTALTNGAGAGAGTITNAPAAGNPTKWIGINDNGTIRYIPAW